jgi:methionyl-tRNA formyltransferase
MRVLKTVQEQEHARRTSAPAFYCENGRCYAECGDGKVLRVLAFEWDGKALSAEEFTARFGSAPLPFEDFELKGKQ